MESLYKTAFRGCMTGTGPWRSILLNKYLLTASKNDVSPPGLLPCLVARCTWTCPTFGWLHAHKENLWNGLRHPWFEKLITQRGISDLVCSWRCPVHFFFFMTVILGENCFCPADFFYSYAVPKLTRVEWWRCVYLSLNIDARKSLDRQHKG